MNVTILWLVNENDEILLSQRAAHMSTDAGMWGPSVSGKVDAGETAEQAAVREANEELGIDPTEILPIHHLYDATHDHSDGRLREFSFFYARVESSLAESMRLEPNEVADVRWVSLSQLKRQYSEHPETVIIASDERLWREIFSSLESIVKKAGN